MNGKRATAAAAAMILFLAALGPRIARSTDEYFQSDAADYMRAATVGFWGLYTDSHTAAAWSLVSLWRKDSEFRARPFDYLYRHNDNAALRHFHGPGSMYFLAVTRSMLVMSPDPRGGARGQAISGSSIVKSVHLRAVAPLHLRVL
jgi:hypothetical protein